MSADKPFTKENLDSYLKELAKEFRKKNGIRMQGVFTGRILVNTFLRHWGKGMRMKRAAFFGMVFGCIISLSACAGTEQSIDMAKEVDETSLVQRDETEQEDTEMTFLDPFIEEQTREILDKPEGVIMKSELLEITEFKISDSDSDIAVPFSDLRWYRNLEIVELWDCGVESLEGVEELPCLRELNVRSNNITNIEPVRELVNLVSFSCAGNQVRDYSALGGLVNLERLQIGDNGCSDTDIASLANLTKLQSLYAPWCGISDISALRNLTNLEYLNLRTNRIEDVSALEGLVRLNYLALASNEIKDITPLYGLTNLTDINLNGNQLSEEALDAFFEEKRGQPFTVTQHGKLREDMQEFTFEVTAHFELEMGCYAVESLAIYDGDTLLQTISVPELAMNGQTYTYDSMKDTLGFELADLNFDGYRDIRLFDTPNGNYREEWIYLVWNPEEHMFENDRRLNEISLASFDQEKKLIYGMERGGANAHYFSTYQYIDREIVKIRYEEEVAIQRGNEQIAHYYELAQVETDATEFSAFHHLLMERNENTGELETVLDEFVFYPIDSEGELVETEELHVEADSELGRVISEDKAE